MTELRVVYIVGKGRSGSTLLDDLLGTIPGVASLGEVRQLWRGATLDGYLCACGQGVTECAVWSGVIRDLNAAGGCDFAAMARQQASVHSWWRMPGMLAGTRPARARDFARTMGQVYRSVAEATGAHTLVDSSKWPAHVGLMGMVPGVTGYGLHLVRDPRAVAYSYTRTLRAPGQPEMPRFGGTHSSLSWTARNVAAELARRRIPAARFQRIRYEDLVAAPRQVVGALGDWLDLEGAADGFVGERSVDVARGHLIGGNPRRFERGRIEIRPDDAWRAHRVSRFGVSAMVTAPLRRRYGYDA